MGLDDNQTSQSRLEYMLDGSSISERESTSDPPSREASSFGRRPREVVLFDDWLVHDFLVNMSVELFSRLRPHFQIPNDVHIRKGHSGEKCYTKGSSDVGFYETAFIVGLRMPLTSLHHRLAAYIGVSVCQITPNAWRLFIGAKVLWGQLSGCHLSQTLEEFFYFYKPQEIPQS